MPNLPFDLRRFRDPLLVDRPHDATPHNARNMNDNKNPIAEIGFYAALVLCRLRNAARIQEHSDDKQADAEERPNAGRGDADENRHDHLALVL